MMESKLVEDLQKLQVFTAYDFFKMDELVQDLTNALEESTRSKGKNRSIEGSRKTKRRSKKRKSHINPMVAWELGNMSEASESSLDEAIKDYMENIVQQSDSDDLLMAARRLPSLAALASNPAFSLAESDSVNENFSPMRPSRRKRRYKRMAVDMQFPSVSDSVPSGGQCYTEPIDGTMTQPTSGTSQCSQDLKPGKRKRCMRDKTSNSFDLDSIVDDCSSVNGGEGSSQNMDSIGVSESGTSSMSSNESDGIRTNDDARDGDDEQSDFYHEVGPSCGIPGIVPWWDSNTNECSTSSDPNFESILRGSFEHMSTDAKRSFQTRLKIMSQPDRRYRSGRRRLNDIKSAYSLSCFLQERQQWTDHLKKRHTTARLTTSSCGSNGKSYDPKRRRKTPPPTEGEVVGGKAEPIPESNIGNRLLQNMGWNPGMGLGADGLGMTNPVFAYRRPWRQGLGTPSTQSAATSMPNS